MTNEPDVLVVGGGPAGLAAAHTLAARGIDRVMLVEREAEPGGIPRYCPHATFGLTDFYRPMSGPRYAARLRAQVEPSKILTGATVTEIGREREVVLSCSDGMRTLRPKIILLATGIRETPRAARLVSGDRPQNVLTTGALQRLAAAGGPLPFRAPLVIGTELVSFSAILTLREHGLRPVAMIESGPRIVARKPADLLTAFVLRTPVMTGCRLIRINASPFDASKMESVTVEDKQAGERAIPCDAVIFTGGFVPESSLLGGLPAAMRDGATRGPAIDQCWRLADQRIYAAGNVLRGVETAAWSRREGAAAANAIADDLLGLVRPRERLVPLVCAEPILFAMPFGIAVPGPRPGPLHMAIRMRRTARGRITLSLDQAVFWRSRPMSLLPERRILLTRDLPDLSQAASVQIGFEPG